MKLGMYNMAPEPTSKMNFVNPSHRSVCLNVYLPVVATQQLVENVTAVMYIHICIYAAIEGFLNPSSSMRSVSYQRKIGD
jgi:hypothetical protein